MDSTTKRKGMTVGRTEKAQLCNRISNLVTTVGELSERCDRIEGEDSPLGYKLQDVLVSLSEAYSDMTQV